MPTHYIDNFQVVQNVPAASPGNIEVPTLPVEDLADMVTTGLKDAAVGTGPVIGSKTTGAKKERGGIFSGVLRFMNKEADIHRREKQRQREQ